MSATTTRRPIRKIGNLLTDEELARVIHAFARDRAHTGRLGGRFTTAEATRVGSWANCTRAMATILDLAMQGKVLIDLDDDGEPMFWTAAGERPA